MLKKYIIVNCILAVGFSLVAMEENEQLSLEKKKDSVAYVLQKSIRNHHFKKNKQIIFENMYKQGILYRDGKVAGYPKENFYTNAYAGAHFLPLARAGNVNAQHNFAMILGKMGRDEDAYRWFKKAADQNFGPSQRNLQKIAEQINERKLGPLSDDVLTYIADYLDNNSLLSLRAAARKFLPSVEKAFQKRSQIKIPLELKAGDQPYPFPYMASYFMRRRLNQLPGVKGRSVSVPVVNYLECANFCQERGFLAAPLFRFMATNYAMLRLHKYHDGLRDFYYNLVEMDHNDANALELRAWFLSQSPVSDDLTHKTESVLYVTEQLITLGRKEVALYYLNFLIKHLLTAQKFEEAKPYCQVSADTSDDFGRHAIGFVHYQLGEAEKAQEYWGEIAKKGSLYAQTQLASIFMKRGDMEQAKAYLKMAADNNHMDSQLRLWDIFSRKGDWSQANQYLKMVLNQGAYPKGFEQGLLFYALEDMTQQKIEMTKKSANQGNTKDQCVWGTFLHRKGMTKEAKEYLERAADQGDIEALHNLGYIFEGENNIEEAKKYYQKAADGGLSHSQYKVAIWLKKEGNREEAKRYCKKAADQGHIFSQFAMGVLLEEEGDKIGARKYFRLASEKGYTPAWQKLRSSDSSPFPTVLERLFSNNNRSQTS